MHIENKYGGLKEGDELKDYFEMSIMKAYQSLSQGRLMKGPS